MLLQKFYRKELHHNQIFQLISEETNNTTNARTETTNKTTNKPLVKITDRIDNNEGVNSETTITVDHYY